MIRRTSLHVGLAIAALFCLPASSLAITRTWTGNAGTSNWGDANNWNPRGVPMPSDEVVIDNDDFTTLSIILNVNSELIGFSMGAGTHFKCVLTSTNRTLTVNGTSATFELGAAGTITLGTNGHLAGTATLTADGQINLQGGTIQCAGLELTGELDCSASGAISADLDILSGGVLRVSGGSLTVQDGFTNAGSIELTNDGATLALSSGSLTNQGTIAAQSGTGAAPRWLLATVGNASSGVVDVSKSLVVDGTVLSVGRITVSDDTLTIAGALVSTGVVELTDDGAAIVVTDGFNNSGTVQSHLGAGVTARSLHAKIGNNGLLEVSKSLTMPWTADELQNNASGTVRILAGTLTVSAGIENSSGGAIELAEDGAELVVAGGALENYGTVSASSGAGVAVRTLDAVLDNRASGRLDVQKSLDLPRSPASHVNQGTVSVSGGRLSVATTLQNLGRTELLNAGATLEVAAGALDNQGQLVGTGEVDGSVQNAGTTSPGLSAGSIHVTGDWNALAAGGLDIEIGGSAPGTEHDRLEVDGTATLGGALHLSRIGGFVATPGQEFVILTCGSRSGTFASVTGADAGGGLMFTPVYGSDRVSLLVEVAPPPPDPTDCEAIADASGVRLTWDPNGAPEGTVFRVYRDSAMVDGDAHSGEVVDEVQPPGIYDYCVEAWLDLGGASGWCCDATSFGFSAAACVGTTAVRIHWTLPGTSADRFDVYWEGVGRIAENLPAGTTEYLHDALTPTGPRTYRVIAYRETPSPAMAEAFATVVVRALRPPEAVTVHAPTACGAIWLDWTKAETAMAYEVWRDGLMIARVGAIPKDPPDCTGSEPGCVQHYIDYGVPGPGTYTYEVRSVDAYGDASCGTAGGSTLDPSPMAVEPWDWFNDVFPSTNEPALPGTPGFDLTTAGPLTGRVVHADYPLIAGDAVLVEASGATRVDLVFRILPGPGNHMPPVPLSYPRVGGGVLKEVPALDVPIGPWTPLTNFWKRFMVDNGERGGASLHVADLGWWSTDTWNSARCDEYEAGRFRTTSGGLPILPADQFTPGTHVEYFFRAEFDPGDPGQFVLLPDTACVMQVRGERSQDGHRWASFNVLPDSWKAAAYGGAGRACALVVDMDDQGGNEQTWSGIADSVGATPMARWGAHDGWHAPGTPRAGYPDAANMSNVDLDDPQGFVALHLGQPGTTWDLYRVRGSMDGPDAHQYGHAGSLGARWVSPVIPGQTPVTPAPTAQMLDVYYRMIILLTGDRSLKILGPLPGRYAPDVDVLETWLGLGSELNPKALYVIGNGIAEALHSEHPSFLEDYLGAVLRHPSYSLMSGNPARNSALEPLLVLSGSHLEVEQNPSSTTPGCDVLALAPERGASAALYGDYGTEGPFIAAVSAPVVPGYPWMSLLEGWNLEDLYGSGTGRARLAYYHETLQEVFGSICSLVSPMVDVPQAPTGEIALVLAGNPSRSGEARLLLGLPEASRVAVEIFDLAGRRVRTLVDGPFTAGPHEFVWSGHDESDRRLPDGLYFARVRVPDLQFEEVRKLTLLK